MAETPADLSAVEKDLIYLRKGAGLTLARLQNASNLLHALGAVGGLATQAMADRLVAAVHSLDGTTGAEALAVALNIPPGGQTLESDLLPRRETYGNRVGRSPDTVRDWEDVALRELALRLISRFYAGAPLDSELVIPHGGFLIESLHVVTLIRDRKFVESQQTRTILSLVDGAKGFRYGTYSPTELSHVQGGLADRPERHDGGTMHTIRFTSPLRRGARVTFSFRERVPQDATDTADNFSGQTFETPCQKYMVEVCFIGDLPASIWAYDKLSRIERPGHPPAHRKTPANATFRASFVNIYGGLCSGVAWTYQTTRPS